MEKTVEDKSDSPISVVGILLLLITLNWIIIIRDSYSRLIDFLFFAWKNWVEGKITNPEPEIQRVCTEEEYVEDVDDDEEKISMAEVKMVMQKLGTNLGDENFCSDEIETLFEEEPSLGEVKEAFDMFDENKDGFIDARELGKIICALGLMEPSELECQKMIRVFDQNGDGRVDFKEFVKLVEDSFC